MIAFCSDVHFGLKHFNKAIFESQMKFFEEQFFPYLLKNDIKNVIHAGDFVHNRTTMDYEILTSLKERFFRWFGNNGVELHTLVGNHDTYFKTSIEPNFYSSEELGEYDNIHVYDEPTIIELDGYSIGMVPWIIDMKKPNLPKKVDILVGHFDIESFPMMPNFNSPNGFKPSKFKEYKMVLSGHYHLKSHKNNIQYLGSPFQLNWGDHDMDRGFHVLEEDYKLTFVENVVNPRFLKIFYREVEKVPTFTVSGLIRGKMQTFPMDDIAELVKENYTKIFVEDIQNQKTFDDTYNLLTTHSRDSQKIEIVDVNEVMEDYDPEKLEMAMEEDGTVITSIEQYMDAMKFDENINKKLLMQMMRQMYGEAEENMLRISTNV